MKITITNTSTDLKSLMTTAGYTMPDAKGGVEKYGVSLLIPTGGNICYIEGLIKPATIANSRPMVVATPLDISTKKLSDIYLITATTQVIYLTLT